MTKEEKAALDAANEKIAELEKANSKKEEAIRIAEAELAEAEERAAKAGAKKAPKKVGPKKTYTVERPGGITELGIYYPGPEKVKGKIVKSEIELDADRARSLGDLVKKV
jgi:septal ring factor EnvC (AmiA/AmiB activator)